ncbi:hypothetical protein ACAG26_20855 [Mycobacterium sp. pUA109]|uniref:hypothetical protein n=1 Tax=Mycobacterium sp. pUA109 TaxID=3238982 RepID=UPI00351B3543
MTDLVVSEDVGRVPGVLVDVGDSLSAGDLSQMEGRQSPSLVAALWVANEVLAQLNQANADHIYSAGDATHQHHRAVTAADEAGVTYV